MFQKNCISEISYTKITFQYKFRKNIMFGKVIMFGKISFEKMVLKKNDDRKKYFCPERRYITDGFKHSIATSMQQIIFSKATHIFKENIKNM